MNYPITNREILLQLTTLLTMAQISLFEAHRVAVQNGDVEAAIAYAASITSFIFAGANVETLLKLGGDAPDPRNN